MTFNDITISFWELSEKPSLTISKYFSMGMFPLQIGLARALVNVDSACPGYAKEMLGRIYSYKGDDEKNLEAILSIFSEIHSANHSVNLSKTKENPNGYYLSEPGSESGKKNPEFRSIYEGTYYAMEVKKPDLINHIRNRHRPTQLPARSLLHKIVDKENTTFPRDNPIKDFLISAQEKFETYITTFPDDLRFLVIYWDSHMYEPISSLLHQAEGLFTENSFYKKDGKVVTFPLVDGVFIIRNVHNFLMGLNGQLTFEGDQRDPFVYDVEGFPHVYIQNPHGRKIPIDFTDKFGPFYQDGTVDFVADYAVTDIINWF